MMRLSHAEIERIEFRRLEKMEPELAAYLRRVAGGRISHVSEDRLKREVAVWARSGHEHGLRTGSSLKKWCFLQLYTNGQLERAPGLSDRLRLSRKAGSSPADELDEIMSATIDALKLKGG